jgi:uncharacterized membrane protein (DUF106 family)
MLGQKEHLYTCHNIGLIMNGYKEAITDDEELQQLRQRVRELEAENDELRKKIEFY